MDKRSQPQQLTNHTTTLGDAPINYSYQLASHSQKNNSSLAPSSNQCGLLRACCSATAARRPLRISAMASGTTASDTTGTGLQVLLLYDYTKRIVMKNA